MDPAAVIEDARAGLLLDQRDFPDLRLCGRAWPIRRDDRYGRRNPQRLACPQRLDQVRDIEAVEPCVGCPGPARFTALKKFSEPTKWMPSVFGASPGGSPR